MNGSAELFMAQSDRRIDAHGAASGDVTGSHRNAEQNDAHPKKPETAQGKPTSKVMYISHFS